MKIKKRNGEIVDFFDCKVENAVMKAFKSNNIEFDPKIVTNVLNILYSQNKEVIDVEEVQSVVEDELMKSYPAIAKSYIIYRYQHKAIREFVESQEAFINRYKKSSNTANATVDDNSNVASKNIAIMNNEIHKASNIETSRGMVMRKLHQLYPEMNPKQYLKDLNHHIIYKHDESSFAGAIAPYCVSASMYPFLLNGIKGLGGLSAAPKNLDSFCGMFINYVFAVSSQFAGAVATSEFLLYFDYFARKEWGDDYYLFPDKITKITLNNNRTVRHQIHQHFQQVIYSINQPSAARGMQAAFVNFSYFDKPFFEGMFGNFYFPDGTQPIWESLEWLQKDFMMWFNEERLKTVLTFPVESFALVYKDGAFLDEKSADFVAEEYARGHSFFTYISDSVDSLSSCCFDKSTRIMYSTPNSNNFIKCAEIGEVYEEHKDDIIEVLGYNPYTNKRKWVKGKFVKYKCNELYKLTFKDRADWTTITATHDHLFPISINGIYVDTYTSNLKVGDKLLADKAQWNLSTEDEKEIIEVEIASIEKITEEQDVYCVELLDKNSPYFVLSNGIITHNCRLKNKIQTKEFNFTNGNIGVETGSKSVITLNLNRIIQDYFREDVSGIHTTRKNSESLWKYDQDGEIHKEFCDYLKYILNRVYKYHHAYNECLWDMHDNHLLPVYEAGFIDLNKQYLTIGINGLNEAAEYLGIKLSDNKEYQEFCQLVFSCIKENNEKHKVTTGHKMTFNTECVPAESLAIKNYNWDKADGYWVPEDRNLYASYIYLPSDESISVLEKIRMHGNRFIGEYLDGGSAAHINLSEHLSEAQYKYILKYAAEEGCQYLTFNIPNSECRECHYITKRPITKCPKCGSEHIDYWDRVIGYLTKKSNWSDGRQKEKRVYEDARLKICE